MYNAGIALCLWSYPEDIARWVAFALQNSGHLFYQTTFLRRGECLPCYSEAILRESATIISDAHQEREVAHVI